MDCMKKKVVFISLPMDGRSDEDILADINYAKKAYLQVTGEDIQEVAFVNNLERGKAAVAFERDLAAEGYWIEPLRMPVWYLGIAMCNIADADVVMFYGEWKKARGCLIEEKVCELYDIPMIKLISETKITIDKD